MIDAEYGNWRVVIKDCAPDSAPVNFYRRDAHFASNGWSICEITAQESARVDRAGLHIHRRAGIRAGDFLCWLHKKAVDLPASPARSNLLHLLVQIDQCGRDLLCARTK